MWEQSGDSWFTHLAVSQPFDVPNTNMLIYSAEGGNDEAEVTATLPLFTCTPPLFLLTYGKLIVHHAVFQQ